MKTHDRSVLQQCERINLCDLYRQVSFSPRYNLAKVSTLILACPPPQKKKKNGKKEEKKKGGREIRKETYLNGTWTKMRKSKWSWRSSYPTIQHSPQDERPFQRSRNPSSGWLVATEDTWLLLNVAQPSASLSFPSPNQWMSRAESRISARIAAMSTEIMSVCVHISLIRIQVHHTWQAVTGHTDIWAPVSIHLLKVEQIFLFLDENNTK